jgi:hypothetical protein
MCALGIAFTSTAILTSHYAILKQGKTLLELQNNLEGSRGKELFDVFRIESSAIKNFLHKKGVIITTPFHCIRAKPTLHVKLKNKIQLVGVL